ncbi:MAG: DUF742 domain-containing protein [Streptosporangiales bacterium]|nr:DUF742 domain-containing protein [Streptosporangiales bacterium]
MTADDDEVWLDEQAGRLIRPYTVSSGRTRPSVDLDLLSLVMTTGRSPKTSDPEHAQALGLCRRPTSVAEVAAHLRLPVVVTKVILADLLDCDAMTTKTPRRASDPKDRVLLEKLLDGLQRL